MEELDLAIPTLPCRSMREAVAFYHRLGFEGGPHQFNNDYAILIRGSIELHLFVHRELVPAESSAGCYLRVQDVDSLYEAWSAAALPSSGIPRLEPIGNKPWGLREFAMVDPDGTLIRVGQVISEQPVANS